MKPFLALLILCCVGCGQAPKPQAAPITVKQLDLSNPTSPLPVWNASARQWKCPPGWFDMASGGPAGTVHCESSEATREEQEKLIPIGAPAPPSAETPKLPANDYVLRACSNAPKIGDVMTWNGQCWGAPRNNDDYGPYGSSETQTPMPIWSDNSPHWGCPSGWVANFHANIFSRNTVTCDRKADYEDEIAKSLKEWKPVGTPAPQQDIGPYEIEGTCKHKICEGFELRPAPPSAETPHDIITPAPNSTGCRESHNNRDFRPVPCPAETPKPNTSYKTGDTLIVDVGPMCEKAIPAGIVYEPCPPQTPSAEKSRVETIWHRDRKTGDAHGEGVLVPAPQTPKKDKLCWGAEGDDLAWCESHQDLIRELFALQDEGKLTRQSQTPSAEKPRKPRIAENITPFTDAHDSGSASCDPIIGLNLGTSHFTRPCITTEASDPRFVPAIEWDDAKLPEEPCADGTGNNFTWPATRPPCKCSAGHELAFHSFGDMSEEYCETMHSHHATCADKSRILLTAEDGKHWCMAVRQ